MTKSGVCIAKHLNHVAIAVYNIENTLEMYKEIFGLNPGEIFDIPDQGVKAVLSVIGNSQLEFIQPNDSNGSVARFLERQGEGLHHICFEVTDLQGKLRDLEAKNIEVIDKEPREGLAGMISFLHPRSTNGVLIELVDVDSVRS